MGIADAKYNEKKMQLLDSFSARIYIKYYQRHQESSTDDN